MSSPKLPHSSPTPINSPYIMQNTILHRESGVYTQFASFKRFSNINKARTSSLFSWVLAFFVWFCFFFAKKRREKLKQLFSGSFCIPYYFNKKDIFINSWSLLLLILPMALKKNVKNKAKARKLQAGQLHLDAREDDRAKQKLFLDAVRTR